MSADAPDRWGVTKLPLSPKQKAIHISWAFTICQGSTLKKNLRLWHTVPLLHGKEMGKKWKQWQILFSGLQNHCRQWLQPWNEKKPAPWKENLDKPRFAMANLDSALKSRDLTWLTKIYVVKAIVFPVVMYECESWPIKKAECWRTDAFELWCWRRLLRFPWTAGRAKQPILKEISPEYSLEGLMLKLKLQYFGHLMRTANRKTLMLGKMESKRRRG